VTGQQQAIGGGPQAGFDFLPYIRQRFREAVVDLAPAAPGLEPRLEVGSEVAPLAAFGAAEGQDGQACYRVPGDERLGVGRSGTEKPGIREANALEQCPKGGVPDPDFEPGISQPRQFGAE
jgi:hypothetical protein